jgi:tetratricopeptide (TPR) repeat protein
MGRMGRIRERAYSMLSVSDFKVLEKMKLFEDYIKLYDLNQADSVLNEIKEILGNSILDKQFLIRAESLVNYHLKRISKEEYLDGFQKAIRLTIPKYGSISLSNWPLNFNEAMLLINISTAYAENDDYLKAIDVIKEAYSAMKQSYMEEQQRAILLVTIANNLSKWYGLTESHEKAIEIANEGIIMCKKFKLGNALPNLLYSVAWNKEKLIELGVLSPANKSECLMYLKQGYYIASVMQLPFMEQFMEKHITTKYNVPIEVIND